MKIVFQNVIVLLSFVAYNYFCLAKDEDISIGVFQNQGQENFKNAHLDEIAKIQEIQDSDRLEIVNQFCEILRTNQNFGFSAIFGPQGDVSSTTIESICQYLNLPYITTTRRKTSGGNKEFPHSFNVFPDANLLSKGLASVVKSLNWKEFVIIYQDERNLMELQDIMKLPTYKTDIDTGKDGVWLRQLSPDREYRPMLKEIRNATIRPIILACDTDLILGVIKQAAEVKLLSDISTNLFITSLDAHTIPVRKYKEYGVANAANVTTVRLFDPFNENFIRLANQHHFPDHTSILVETAVTHDAMTLLSKAIETAKEERLTHTYYTGFKPEPKTCTDGPYSDSLDIIKHLKETALEEGESLTGAFQLKDGKRDDFKLELVEMIDEKAKLIGIWDSTTDRVQLQRNASQREVDLQQRIANHTFIVAYKLVEPYIMVDPTSFIKIKGYAVDLLSEIAISNNMTLTWVEKPTTPDIIVALEQTTADLGICDFTITQERAQRIDFSSPFMSVGISILHKKLNVEEIDNMYAFMRPFSWTVWMYTMTLFVIMSVVILFISRLDPDDWENPHPCDQNPEELENIWGIRNCFWLTMGSFMTQGCDILPKGVCSRIATAMWWFFSLIMTSTYTANLAAFLTERRKDDSIKSVEDLANQNKIKYGLMKNGATQAFFEHSNHSLYSRMWNQILKESPSVFEDSNDSGLQRVINNRNGMYAFFMESAQIDYEMERHCELRKIGQWLDSKHFGIGMPFNAAYRAKINSAILSLSEGGKLSELKEKWWKKMLGDHQPCGSEQEGSTDELTLENVGGIFVVLATGIGLAFVFAILEFVWNVRRISVQEHISFWEALKVEVKFACNITVTKKRAKPLISESSSSSSGSSRTTGIPRSILAGAGSVLNINTNILTRIGSNVNLNRIRDDSL